MGVDADDAGWRRRRTREMEAAATLGGGGQGVGGAGRKGQWQRIGANDGGRVSRIATKSTTALHSPRRHAVVEGG